MVKRSVLLGFSLLYLTAGSVSAQDNDEAGGVAGVEEPSGEEPSAEDLVWADAEALGKAADEYANGGDFESFNNALLAYAAAIDSYMGGSGDEDEVYVPIPEYRAIKQGMGMALFALDELYGVFEGALYELWDEMEEDF